MRDRKKRNIIIGALCCLLVFMGIGYAILSQTLNISGIANMKGNWNVRITNMELLSENKTGRAEEVSHSFTDTTATFTADLYMPGDSIEYRVTVENQGNMDAVLNDIKQTKTNQHKDIKFSNSLIGTEVLTAGSTMTFTMKVEFLESAEAIADIEKTEYRIELVYIQYNGGEYTPPAQSIGTLSDKILADNTAQSDSSIDFSQISSDTNGKGLYYTSTNTEGNKTTYYFRGDVTNNYVKFGSQTKNTCRYNGTDVMYLDLTNHAYEYNPTEEQCLSTNVCVSPYYGNLVGIGDTKCSDRGGTLATEKATFTSNATEDILWRVVRINEDGSTRLITESPVGSSTFNTEYDDNAYVGYMYGTAGSSTYEATHTNTNNSTVKDYLDNWYQTNLLSYSSYMSLDAGFCNDRSIATTANTWYSRDTALGYGSKETYYGAYNRLRNTQQPQFACPQTNDLFTMSTSSKGNKTLTYPVGLITVDELVYAGGTYNNANATYYLNNSTIYWTMSPWYFFGGYAFVGNVRRDVNVGYVDSYDVLGVRAAVNLSSYVEITGGNGTFDNPYVVK